MAPSLPTTLAAAAAAAALASTADACTIFMAGKKATADGVNMVSHTDDAGGAASDVRLIRTPAMDHKPGSKRPIYQWANGYPRLVSKYRGPQYMPVGNQTESVPIGWIDQVNHTYALWENDYGLINEHNLAMGESTVNSKLIGYPTTIGPAGKCIWGIAELSRLALERCKTARCAIKTMGEAAEKGGFYSEDSGTPETADYDDSAEALGICDMDECWVFNIMTGDNTEGALWAAQRLGDDQVTAIPNSITIRHMDLDDHDTFMYSANVQQVAKDRGWWDGKEEFDFFKAYGYDYPDKWDEAVDSLYSGRRLWSFYNLMAPSLHLDGSLGEAPKVPTYNFSITPDKPVTFEMWTRAMRDYFQNTTYDTSKGMGAGPFANPLRFDTDSYGLKGSWDRSTVIFRGVFSHIHVLDPKLPAPLNGQMWYGQHEPMSTVYLPFFGDQDAAPVSYITGINSKFNRDSAWWAFDFLGNWIMLKWSFMIPEVQAAQKQWEAAGHDMIARLTTEINKLGPNSYDKAKSMAQAASNDHASACVKAIWALGEHLISKYSDGYITTGEGPNQQQDGSYPKAWLENTEFMKYPHGKWPAEVRNMTDAPTPPPVETVAKTAFKAPTNLNAPVTQESPVVAGVLGAAAGALLGGAAVWAVMRRRRKADDMNEDPFAAFPTEYSKL